MTLNKDELISQVFKEDNIHELQRLMNEQASLNASAKCLAFLIDTNYFKVSSDLVPLILVKGIDNFNTHKTLDVLFSKKPDVMLEHIPSFQYLNPIEYFIQKGLTPYFKIAIHHDKYFSLDVMDKLFKECFYQQYDKDKLSTTLELLSVAIEEVGGRGIFLPQHFMKKINELGPPLKKAMNQYHLEMEKFMIELSFSTDKNTHTNSTKRKI